MSDTTTIQITAEQRAELERRKLHGDESIKTVIARLLDGDSADGDEIADAVVSDLRASLPADVADAVETRLR